MSVVFNPMDPAADQVSLTLEVGFASNPLDASQTWTDISAYIRNVGWTRGRFSFVDRMRAGVLVAVLDNADRRFDPLYTSSPYNPDVVPVKAVRLQAVHNSITYNLFYGYAESWNQRFGDRAGKDSIVELRVSDAFALIGRAAATSTYSQELSGTRVGNILDDVSWPAGLRSIDTGTLNMAAVTLDCQNALQELHRVAESEGGLILMDGQGRLVFQDNGHRSGLSVSATWGDGPSGQANEYAGVVLEYDDTHIYNRVEGTRVGGAASVAAEDATSIAAYGRRIRKLNDLLVVDDTDLTTAVTRWRDRYKDPLVRFTSLRFFPRKAPSSLWPQALGRELSDKVTIKYNHPGGGAETSQDVFIEGMEHRVSPGAWLTTYRTSNVT